jgi:hypothetical protein
MMVPVGGMLTGTASSIGFGATQTVRRADIVYVYSQEVI